MKTENEVEIISSKYGTVPIKAVKILSLDNTCECYDFSILHF